jgi:hypothetical protein
MTIHIASPESIPPRLLPRATHAGINIAEGMSQMRPKLSWRKKFQKPKLRMGRRSSWLGKAVFHSLMLTAYCACRMISWIQM